MGKGYLLLFFAVLFEAVGTTSLQASQQLSRFWPSVGVLVGFGTALYLLMHVLKYLPLGITYAVWSGMGICLTALIGWVVYQQKVDVPALIGLAMIVSGIVVINLFSTTASH
ncbi:Multidrug transporter EmrE [Roseovarius albus]|uniref:Multidrug transporter EmrE n=1 Tax=Roseovarius albus TaxID=1247867 RepID=A0A1X6Z0S3_9RHOB|nr:SMR family transporter [Roseovarius albus]SLN36890.1 Multidrug transporter EmrE [Roseovarius albus]